ncbi:MAG: YeeE/YedE family protein [Elusimicrobia bacterium]|nr:YeeE/YedE family protein [Elusimicrobiota bacterium]
MTSFASGLLFGLGLGLSGMTDPKKVVGFLDFFGGWDPSLAFVMGGAVLTHGLGLHLVKRDGKTLCRTESGRPEEASRGGKLVFGACVFGLGWGLGGYCPGPALVAAGAAGRQPLVFLAALAVGTLAAAKAAGSDCG